MANLTKEDIGQPVILFLLDKDPAKKKYGVLVDIDETFGVALVSVGIEKPKQYPYDDVEIDFYSGSYIGTKPTLIIPERQIIIKKPPKKKLVTF